MAKMITDIDPSKVKGGLNKYAGQYVVLSTNNEVMGSGATYKDATRNLTNKDDVAIFTIPEADVDIAPLG
jgi:hypothetical protein